MKVFLSGKMTGEKDYGREVFMRAEQNLKELDPNIVVLNPAILPLGMDYEDYMDICFAMIYVSDCVALLPGWEESNGSRRERAFAHEIGIPVRTYNLTVSKIGLNELKKKNEELPFQEPRTSFKGIVGSYRGIVE